MTWGPGFPRSVTVYGTGLIGSSFALAIKKCLPETRVFGVDAPEILAQARHLGIVDSGEGPSDLTVLAAPVGAILDLIERIPAGPGVILDVGSTKLEICRKAEARGLPFVGGHPMTGSEKSGPEAASAGLFEGAPFFLCPISTTPADALDGIRDLAGRIGAVPNVLSAEAHDRLVAKLSHLPQVLSTLVADCTAGDTAFAGPGWKSFTRLAGSPFHVWRDILETSGSLPEELQSFIERLRGVLDALERGEMTEVEAMFTRANRSVGAARE